MDVLVTGLLYLLTLVLFWTAGSKILQGRALAGSEDMAWATRPGLASGAIAGVVEAAAAAIFLVTAIGVIDNVVAAIIAAVGIAAHEGVAVNKAAQAIEAEQQSRVPNFVIGAIALLTALLLLLV